MSGAGVKRIIYVAGEYKKTLLGIAAGVASLSYAEKHKEVKRQLEAKGIPHREFDGHPSQVPEGHGHWHA